MEADVEKVIKGGFCVGCGGCAAIDSGIKMQFTDTGVYVPIIKELTNPKVDEVCPFSNKGPNENELINLSFGKSNEEKLGRYISLKAGYDQNNSRRLNSSSGGGVTWILEQLFTEGFIDKVIHIKESHEDGKLFKYSVSNSIEEIHKGAKTRYYPIEISEIYKYVKENKGKYAFVGLPCFVKTVKRLALIDSDFADKLKFTISIFCGHLKSAAFGESLAWQLGVKPDNIKNIDFRHKILTAPANNYGISISTLDSNTYVSPMDKLLGKDWGMGAFRLNACDFCDDIVGEIADVSFGDAWLDKYKSNSKGTNLIIIRNLIIKKIFEQGLINKSFYTEDITSQEVVSSQNASFRHRRDGLKHRLKKLKKSSKWHPKKREFSSTETPTFADKLNWDYRSWYSQKTHLYFLNAKKSGSLKIYTDFVIRGTTVAKALQKLIRIYKRIKSAIAQYNLKTKC